MTKKVLYALFALMFSSVAFAQHDQYGEWLWPGMDGIPNPVWLKSTSSNPHDPSNVPTTLWVEFNGSTSTLCFVLEKDASEVELSFDNGDFMYFNFVNYDGGGYPTMYPDYRYLQFVTGDRYRNTINHDATNMLKQMSRKNILKIRYKDKNRSTHTEIFNLEGLEAILEVIYE